jgi:hypothetical protein
MRKLVALSSLAFVAAHPALAHPSVIKGNDEYEFTYRVLAPEGRGPDLDSGGTIGRFSNGAPRWQASPG